MATAFAGEAAHIRELGLLEVPDIAPGHRGQRDNGARMAARDSLSVRSARRASGRALVHRRALVRVMEATYVPVWVRKPIALLDDDKPLDVIAAGEYRRVSQVVAGLEASGAA